MKAIVTGAHGRVGSILVPTLADQGIEVVKWDRSRVPVNDRAAMQAFLARERPNVVFHLGIAEQSTGLPNEQWVVNVEWPGILAELTRELGIKMVHTSTVSVFSDDAKGPFTLASQPDAPQGYGYTKRMAEGEILSRNADAIVARIGWQIGAPDGSDNMADYLDKAMRKDGKIGASRQWHTSCSFLQDTASALLALSTFNGGLYMVDSNPRWTFYEIVCALNHLYGRGWVVEPNDDFIYDQRMINPRVPMPMLNARLPTLKS